MAVVSERFDDLGSDGAPARLGLMGGTFDPIHNGHLRVAEEMREELCLDAVVFIPTGAPVFKRDQQVTDAETRYAQVRAAVASNPHFDASRIEIDREGDTFTVDTLRQLREHYPENVEFYFIVGSDSAATVGKWRGCAEIAELAHLAVAVGRPGSADAATLERVIMEAAPFKLHLVRVSILEISSTNIRQRLAEGRSVRYLVPGAIAGYGCLAGATSYGGQSRVDGRHKAAPTKSDGGVSAGAGEDAPAGSDGADPDVLSKAFFNARKAELEKRVSAKRFQHSLGVSDACVQLAEEYGLDVKKARLAGLLHDWDKGYDDEGARARVRELGMEDEIDPVVVENMPGTLHGITAARALGNEFPSIPADVLQAISRHTTAALDMEPLDMVLYIADAIEPNRQFGRIDELRAHVGKATLEQLYFETYEYWVFLLFERRKPLHPDTIRIWNAYTQRLPRKGKRDAGDGSVSGKKHKHKK